MYDCYCSSIGADIFLLFEISHFWICILINFSIYENYGHFQAQHNFVLSKKLWISILFKKIYETLFMST